MTRLIVIYIFSIFRLKIKLAKLEVSINHPSTKNAETINVGSKHPTSEGHLWFRQQQHQQQIPGGRTWEAGRECSGSKLRQCHIDDEINFQRGGEYENHQQQQQQKSQFTTPEQQQNSNRERRKAIRATPVDEEDYP